MKAIVIHVPAAAHRSLVIVDALQRRPIRMKDRRLKRSKDARSKRREME